MIKLSKTMKARLLAFLAQPKLGPTEFLDLHYSKRCTVWTLERRQFVRRIRDSSGRATFILTERGQAQAKALAESETP